jgi:hypothetical protein
MADTACFLPVEKTLESLPSITRIGSTIELVDKDSIKRELIVMSLVISDELLKAAESIRR